MITPTARAWLAALGARSSFGPRPIARTRDAASVAGRRSFGSSANPQRQLKQPLGKVAKKVSAAHHAGKTAVKPKQAKGKAVEAGEVAQSAPGKGQLPDRSSSSLFDRPQGLAQRQTDFPPPSCSQTGHLPRAHQPAGPSLAGRCTTLSVGGSCCPQPAPLPRKAAELPPPRAARASLASPSSATTNTG